MNYPFFMKEVITMLRGYFGLFLRAIVICYMVIVATRFVHNFYIELNKEVYLMNRDVNRVYTEMGLEF